MPPFSLHSLSFFLIDQANGIVESVDERYEEDVTAAVDVNAGHQSYTYLKGCDGLATWRAVISAYVH